MGRRALSLVLVVAFAAFAAFASRKLSILRDLEPTPAIRPRPAAARGLRSYTAFGGRPTAARLTVR